MIFFTSDTHFYHRNIIRYCDRPWCAVEDMNEALIAAWNAKVGPQDHVYHLGDLSFGNVAETSAVLAKLNGKISITLGNHDRKNEFGGRLEILATPFNLTAADYNFVMGHWPLPIIEGATVLHGHCHGKLDEINASKRRVDVGVDSVHGRAAGYAPLSLTEVCSIVKAKEVS